MASPALARYRSYVSYRLEHVASKARATADAIYLREVGLDIRALRVLRRVAERPGLTVSEIVEGTLFERTLVSRLITELVAKKLLERSISPIDARQFQIGITPAGLQKVIAADELGDALNDDLLSTLDPAERAMFDRCLEKLVIWQPATDHAAAAAQPPSARAGGGRRSRTVVK
jgi:DNA-binding MarR family transcriptional regulator